MLRSLPVRAVDAVLPESIDHSLKLYSIAALAAGVSILALAPPAEGSVIVTNTNIPINPGASAAIDLNNDGINDFGLAVAVGGYDHSFYTTFAITPLTGGKVVGGARGSLGPYASALVSGANIGASEHFSSSVGRGQVTIERSNGAQSGPTVLTYKLYGKWGALGSSQYLGVKFLIKGVTHYGWVRLTVSRSEVFSGATRISGTITEYAYETVANKKIGAGATTDTDESAATQIQEGGPTPSGPSLGMLALGANGLTLWRQTGANRSRE
jgi:hypothetical protein